MLQSRIDAVRRWMFEAALPFWATAGVDGELGFVETLSMDTLTPDSDFKRLRVQARQVYVYSHAALQGYAGGVEVARSGWAFMTRHAWSDDTGWAKRLTREGAVTDATPDLYDQAFGLFATAWWIKASGDASALPYADKALAAIDRHLATPDGRGWLSDPGSTDTRIQNPHMHMLEALLALHAATGEARFLERAARIVELFHTTLFDPATGTLAEYYDADWKRATGERGRIVEPGHQLEWAWLLHQAERHIPGAAGPAKGLFDFALRTGVAPETGLIWDEVLDDGTVRLPTHRTWPHTEALKAHLALFEAGEGLDAAALASVIDNLLNRYLAAPRPGAWVDRLDAEGRTISTNVPASSFYHLFLAFSELLRLAPALTQAA